MPACLRTMRRLGSACRGIQLRPGSACRVIWGFYVIFYQLFRRMWVRAVRSAACILAFVNNSVHKLQAMPSRHGRRRLSAVPWQRR